MESLLLEPKKWLDKVKADNADEATRIQIVARAVEAPLRTIVENAGLEGSVVVAKVSEGKDNFGYNAKTDKYVRTIAESRCIEYEKSNPCGVGKRGFGFGNDFVTTECALVDIKEENAGGGMLKWEAECRHDWC